MTTRVPKIIIQSFIEFLRFEQSNGLGPKRSPTKAFISNSSDMKDQWPTFISGNLEWEVWARSRYDMTKKKEKKKRAEKMCG